MIDTTHIIEKVIAVLKRDPRFPKLTALEWLTLFADLQRDLEQKFEEEW
jgi:hypothetical protein